MKEALDELSSERFVVINNTFPFLFADLDSQAWKIDVSHCTHREIEFSVQGKYGEGLESVLQMALEKALKIESEYEKNNI